MTSLEPLLSCQKLERIDLSYCPPHLDTEPLHELNSLRVIECIDRPDIEILAPIEPPADPKPGDIFYERIGNCRLKMVWIPDGMFQMGSSDNEEGRYDDEGPQHEVKLTGFWLAAEPVTQSQYEAVMDKNPSHSQGPNNPVENVSREDAMEFCQKLSDQTKRKFTLPSEAQWEYACRAGSKTKHCFGNSEKELGDYAWYAKNSKGQTQPVGKKKPNGWGLYDMHGNVWEWCLDWYGKYSKEQQENPTGPESGTYRVLRGGGWFIDAEGCRSAVRNNRTPGNRFSYVGFRVLAVRSGSK